MEKEQTRLRLTVEEKNRLNKTNCGMKGKWGFCKDCDLTWKLNAVGK